MVVVTSKYVRKTDNSRHQDEQGTKSYEYLLQIFQLKTLINFKIPILPSIFFSKFQKNRNWPNNHPKVTSST